MALASNRQIKLWLKHLELEKFLPDLMDCVERHIFKPEDMVVAAVAVLEIEDVFKGNARRQLRKKTKFVAQVTMSQKDIDKALRSARSLAYSLCKTQTTGDSMLNKIVMKQCKRHVDGVLFNIGSCMRRKHIKA